MELFKKWLRHKKHQKFSRSYAGKLFRFTEKIEVFSAGYPHLTHKIVTSCTLFPGSVVFVVDDYVPLTDWARDVDPDIRLLSGKKVAGPVFPKMIVDESTRILESADHYLTPLSWFVKFMYEERYYFVRIEQWAALLTKEKIVLATVENSS